ncbi:PIR Superfamily Protein [Plasmodium ovale curtisi]|uniref:PIR Superfamily Protein n=1 Tax=Plasmodium ovale curtisi TaxID=864141 RepID=A0A1A8WJ23_PLAOA|nr:PIR Superfamily Protein [Plasmodium ovale curtisi]SBT02865.1 PIR Superfamily Protein [Plasmodium ovale curtisi]
MESSEIDKLESSLGHLPAYKIYKTFELQNDGQSCNTYFPGLLELHVKDSKITEFCKNVASIVKYISGLSDVKNIQEHCIYFNFYIYSLIKKKFSSFSHEDKESIIYAIYDKWTNISKMLLKDKCSFKLEFRDNNDLNKWIDMKSIFDYIKNYNFININDFTTEEICKAYIKYTENIKTLYEKYKPQCSQSNGYYCYFYYISWKKVPNPNELIKKLKCNEIMSSSSHRNGHYTAFIENTGLPHDSHPEAKEKMEDTVTSTHRPFKTSMVIVSPIIGILLITSFFYKFSPLGLWLRRKLQRKIYIKHISDKEDTEESLEGTEDHSDINSNSIPYNISYQHI